MNYDDSAIGVECALPAAIAPAHRKSFRQRVVGWLIALLAGRI